MALLKWAHPEHPVFWIESRRQTRNRGLITLQRVLVPTLFGVTGLVLSLVMAFMLATSYSFYDLDSMIESVLSAEILVLMCIQLGAGAIANVLTVAVTAPLISGEVELQSWRLLRTTLVTLPEIIFAKLAAVLYEIRTMLGGLLIVRLISTGTILIFFLPLVHQSVYYRDMAGLRVFLKEGTWVAYIILMLTIAFYNLSQPIVQAVLSGMLGMTASAFARSRSQSIAGGLVARLICWVGAALLHVALIYGLGYLFSNWSSPSYSSIEVFRNISAPTENQIIWTACLTASGYLLGTWVAQVGLIFVLMGTTLRWARRLEV